MRARQSSDSYSAIDELSAQRLVENCVKRDFAHTWCNSCLIMQEHMFTCRV